MPAMDADRSFSEQQHRLGAWQTSPHAKKNRLYGFLLRLLSFKYRELHRFSMLCNRLTMVIDAGCGNGVYSSYCHRVSGATVVAVDWSFTALRNNVARRTPKKVFPVCADMHHLPFKNGCAGGLFSIDTLGHLRDQERALDEIDRVCKRGVPLFLHSECADYRTRWPDRVIMERCGEDLIAAIDGHCALRMSAVMYGEYRKRFILRACYSPAGITGWLTGYPEKYRKPLAKARLYLPAFMAAIMSMVKGVPVLRYLLRGVNMAINCAELLFVRQGGGSCFARAETRSSPVVLRSVDVIVPTWKRSSHIAPAVAALAAQCRYDDNILVVWQGDERPQVADDPRVTLVHLQKPSLPAARNRGIQEGKNDVVVFVDDDCEIRDGLLDAHRRCYEDPAVGAVAGHIDDPVFTQKEAPPSLFNVVTGEIRQHFNCQQSGPAVTLMGANMSFLRTALGAAGTFDEQYCNNALWEDVDMGFRILNAGYTLRFCADASVKHLRYPDGGCRYDTGAKYLYHLFANTTYFACTYAAVENAAAWWTFWWHHLEYYARKKTYTGPFKLFRYRPLYVVMGLLGVCSGVRRFLLHGKRRPMPAAVIKNSNQFFGDGR